jgi:hypothetical protein
MGTRKSSYILGSEHSDAPPICESAWGPDADRHAKLLIHLAVEGSTLNAYLQPKSRACSAHSQNDESTRS